MTRSKAMALLTRHESGWSGQTSAGWKCPDPGCGFPRMTVVIETADGEGFYSVESLRIEDFAVTREGFIDRHAPTMISAFNAAKDRLGYQDEEEAALRDIRAFQQTPRKM